MPLSERDVNARQRIPRDKRYSISPESLPGAENAAPAPNVPRAKGTLSRQQRFLAPTKASSAKTTPPTLDRKVQHPHSGRSTPQQQQPHKLPKTKPLKRDGANPPIVPPMSKWSLPLANRNDRFAQDSLPASQSSPLFSHATRIAQAQSSASSHTLDTVHRQALAKKPLPSRPIVTLMDGPSPTKDSRCLLDASEKPIHLSIAGSEHEWPTLIPSPSTTPVMESTPPTSATDQTQPFSPSGRRPFSNSSLLSASPELTRTINGQLSETNNTTVESHDERPASLSSYLSAPEDTPFAALYESPSNRDNTRVQGPRPLNLTPVTYPPRTTSLQGHSASSSPYDSSPYGRAQNSAMSTRTAESALQSPLSDPRPHSPSPANFSRLRPTSISQPSPTMTTAAVSAPVKTPKTASRIPLPDSKKATLVDIKSRRSSGIPMLKLEKGQTFGARRMNSPDPLAVLDNGIKRRQLARADTSGSASTASTVPTKVLNPGSASRNHSKNSFPGSTTGRSSDDEEEITTPSDKSSHLVKHGFRPKHLNRASGSHYGGATLKVYDDAEVVLGRPPPSNSPFTGPLQTIHSQSALPLMTTHSRESSEGRFIPRVVIKPTEFGGFASRLSKMQNIQGSSARNSRARYSVVSNRSDLLPDRTELVDVLKEAEHEDALISQCGALGLDTSTREDIKHTLSMLEGNSGPAITAVDPEKLSLMIGRLKLGFEKAPKSAAFIEDATVAERFLARRGSSTSDSVARVIMAKANGGSRDVTPHNTEGDTDSHHSRSKTVASKWSNSSSDKDLSLTLTNNTLAHHTDDYDGHLPGLPSKDDGHVSTGSIGYPSRINGKAQRIIGPDERSITTQKTGIRRVSSPTLGARVPGSVRVAREKAKSAAGEIASRNVVSDKFKTNKMPTPNTKAYKFDDPPRGRKLSIGKPGSKSSTPKTPRSRSKSRYVLDKINGLFTSKRDKRQSSIPPVPPLKNIKQRPLAGKKGATITTRDSPLPLPPRTPPLTKMPTISPPVDAVHPALRSATSAASFAQSATTIAGNADYEDRDSIQAWSEKLVGRAKQEGDPARKERLLNFAKVLNDSLISAREAQISAETAQTAARSAQVSYEMTMKSVAMLQRLASSMNRR